MNANFKVFVIVLACSSGAISAQEKERKSESQESIGTSSAKDDRSRQQEQIGPVLWDRLDSKRIMKERRERALKKEASKLL